VILCDTGPLVALLIEDDPSHERCASAIAFERGPLLTTEACLTEAFHLIRRAGGWVSQSLLWDLIQSGDVVVFTPSDSARLRAGVYVKRYADQPCDYADATLLVAAEDTGIRRVFTIDSHFYAYRLIDGSHLNVLP